jgi:hypothetical protein
MMLERVFDLFERFVIAHEQLAAILGNHDKLVLPVMDKLPEPTSAVPVKELAETAITDPPLKELVEMKAPPPELTEKELAEKRKEDRGWLKAKLEEMGVDFTSKMATATLIKKYEEAMAERREAAPHSTEEETPLTIEYLRETLQGFITEYPSEGRAAAKKMLADLGAVNLTSLEPARYGELLSVIRGYRKNHMPK